jgi:cellulose synthase/poly-beta-1,6-N-acetylglucosamine synthase-like glycosyltransferase
LAKQHKENPSFSLTKYNIQSGVERRNWQADIINHYSQMNEKYSLESLTSEMGFCIIVPTYNNANNFRAELNLNSIFSQNYTNYKVVIIDDASQDQTATIIRKYL